jgi:hypothetical protein
MAKAAKARPLGELRKAVGRVQAEGERLAGRIRKDARTLLAHGRAELLKDVRAMRAGLEGRAGRALRQFERRVVKEFHAATTERVAALERRVTALEKRFGELERKLAGVAERAA